MPAPDSFTQIRCSRKPYTCDSCEQEIPAGSSYRMRQFLDYTKGPTAREANSIRRWHDACPLPAPLSDWTEQAAARAARRAAYVHKTSAKLIAWRERSGALRGRLEALGVQHREPEDETPKTGALYTLVPPFYFKLNLDAVERLLTLAEQAASPLLESP